MTLEAFVDEFNKRLEKDSLAIFTGAGLSTASGIRDFRGKNGLYKESNNVEEKLSYPYFRDYPASFYTYYVDHLIVPDSIKPNEGHILIKNLQDEGYVTGVITQNIDGLDALAGTKDVIELHGTSKRFYCTKCHHDFPESEYVNPDVIPPRCKELNKDGTTCNGIIRPDIVLYGEPLDYEKQLKAREVVLKSSTILVLGTKLNVRPACDYIKEFIIRNQKDDTKGVFIVNMGPTDCDGFEGVYKYDGDIIEFTRELSRVRTKNIEK